MFDQQFDGDGKPHDIATELERVRSFEPDVHLPRQTRLELDSA